MERAVIIGGAKIEDYEYVKSHFRESDFFIFCDCGLKHLESLSVKPNLIIGDFDSYTNPNMPVETIILPTVKDDTDTVFAAKEALKRGFKEVLLIGAVGGRMDHTMANIYILLWMDENGIKATLVDDYSEMEIIKDQTVYISDDYIFFSLINIMGEASGISIKNAKYELLDGRIEPSYQYGVSNEVTKGKTAEVTVKSGKVLLIKVKQE